MNIEVNRVINGNVLDVLKGLPNELADVVVTSPPYWGLRDYGDQNIIVWGGKKDCTHNFVESVSRLVHENRNFAGGSQEESHGTHPESFIAKYDSGVMAVCSECGAWRGQLGLEPHPQMYVDHLQQIFSEVKRVLKKTGSLWLNIGDTFYTKSMSNFVGSNENFTKRAERVEIAKANQIRGLFRSNWLQSKQKLMIPARVAIALQDDGWILRNEVIWHKINHMPESVRDRLTKAYESVFFFVKSRKYYFDLDSIRKPFPKSTWERLNRNYVSTPKSYGGNFDAEKHNRWKDKVLFSDTKYPEENNPKNLGDYRSKKRVNGEPEGNPLGANPADVWSLTMENFKGAHFATFPKKLVRRILRCSCPPKICVECGEPKRKISKSQVLSKRERGSSPTDFRAFNKGPQQGHINVQHFSNGWSSCKCGKDFRSGIVLDPFCGSGTSLYVAHRMGFDWLGIDLNPEYCKMAENRILSHGKIRLDHFVKE